MANDIKVGDALPEIKEECPFFVFQIADGKYVQVKNTKSIPAGTFEVIDTGVDSVIYKEVSDFSSVIHNEYQKGGSTKSTSSY